MPEPMADAWPTCLMLADIGGGSPRHWQSHWLRQRENCVKVDLGCWNDPRRNAWLGRIDGAVQSVSGPSIVVAHGLGALAFAVWVSLIGEAAGRHITGALLVAPPDPESPGADERVRRFGPLPTSMFPFPSILVASENDPQASLDRSRVMACEWVCDFVSIGPRGHGGAGLGRWREGENLLDIVINGGPGLSHYAYRPDAATHQSGISGADFS